MQQHRLPPSGENLRIRGCEHFMQQNQICTIQKSLINSHKFILLLRVCVFISKIVTKKLTKVLVL